MPLYHRRKAYRARLRINQQTPEGVAGVSRQMIRQITLLQQLCAKAG